ncbi:MULTISPECIES: MBL fold metallo-hydrolase [unclassified Meiothermus]|uniref:MBL fold metallo-hydrolase n=1 Tax=unclassified Meiothermus TaxID=370471 RepID=UPI000D7CFEAB|nr:MULTISPECIES: MBL fold metallo-hydrolase [unclassified Meiothermus]PZA06717.1 MBL fold metallo-hydrolase [Meiothermus sp. Pnk-1]RYM36643.1 MBL fold metallo-hydrolase [Meiothermus sp. PNK-Is4]
MLFKQIYEEGLAQASYLIGCQASGEAVVVDPRRDVQVYLEEAQKNGLKIVAITETHIHADYLSGARELAKATGARLYLSDEGDENWKYRGLEGFDHQPLKDGDQIRVGNVTLTAVHTPGHTPEHLGFLVQDGAAASEPGFLLSGDFVFVGDIGRPDLLEEAAGILGTAEPGARRMFKSLKEKFLTLPDYVQVWPGHGAGSACGKALGAVPSSTVGYERRFAWWADYLARDDEAGFVKALLSGQPEAPSYFAEMKRLNRDGMPILGGLPKPQPLTPEAFQKRLAEGALLVDTRDKLAFAGGHLKGAINIPAGNNFSTWAGWLLPYERDLVLLASPERVEELVKQLIRIGLDRVVGFIPGLEGYAQGELETVPQLTAAEAKALWEKGEAVILDVRGADEYIAGHIPGAQNLHAGRVMRRLSQIPKDRPVVVHCLGGDRSSTAISALLAAGFTNVINLTGGIRAWREHGFPTEKGEARQAVGA